MAKGYPTREQDLPAVPDLVPADVCIICKRRPRAADGLYCDECSARLRGS